MESVSVAPSLSNMACKNAKRNARVNSFCQWSTQNRSEDVYPEPGSAKTEIKKNKVCLTGILAGWNGN